MMALQRLNIVAQRFYGTTGYYHNPPLISVSLWVRANNYTPPKSALAVSKLEYVGPVAEGMWGLGIIYDRPMFFIYAPPETDQYPIGKGARAASNISILTWHHLLGVYDGTTVFLYWNGSKTTGESVLTPSNLTPLDRAIQLFGHPWELDRGGQLAELGIWSVALGQEEATALAGGMSPSVIRASKLVVYDPLFKGSSNRYEGGHATLEEGAIADYEHPRIIGMGA